jgi:hypothetical protein
MYVNQGIYPIIPGANQLGSATEEWTNIYGSKLHASTALYLGITGDVSLGYIETVAGITGPSISVTGNLVPSVSNEYSLGASGQFWRDLFVGPGTITIAGPTGSTAVATIGTDLAGIVYTESGFATPSIIVGPSVASSGAVGGFLVQTAGITGDLYDLTATQNVDTAGGGLTGPTYSLIDVVRSITGGTGISVYQIPGTTTSPKINYVVELANTGVAAGTYTNPTVSVNETGQVTSIVSGGSAGPTGATGETGATGATGETGPGGIYNLTAIASGPALTTSFQSIGPTTSITVSAATHIAVIANSVAGPIGNNHIYYNYVGISGPAGISGPTSDITSINSTNNSNSYLQNIVMHDCSVSSAGTYIVTMYGRVNNTGGSPAVGNSHIMVFGNMLRTP